MALAVYLILLIEAKFCIRTSEFLNKSLGKYVSTHKIVD